ncbi:MAG: glucokinase [Candidatus Petromonas sp.]|jgi:glucokinase|nr:glucokinase [Candidatus Petromonas sp.]
MSHYNIGIDLGGTKVRVGIVDESGNIIEEITELTECEKGYEYVINKIINMINRLKNKDSVSTIGIGAPGPLDSNKGIIIEPPNLHGWKNVDIVKMIHEKTGIKTILDNDANVAGLAEAIYGAGKNYSIVQYITISTGIGGGLVINRKLISGAQGAAGEIGNMIVLPNGYKHSNLNAGTLEGLCSGTAIDRIAKERKITDEGAKKVFQLAFEGNEQARQLIYEVIDFLAIGIANIIHTINPDVFVLGGGVTESLKKYGYIEVLSDRVKKYVYDSLKESVNIKAAQLGTKSGLIGAGILPFFN